MQEGILWEVILKRRLVQDVFLWGIRNICRDYVLDTQTKLVGIVVDMRILPMADGRLRFTTSYHTLCDRHVLLLPLSFPPVCFPPVQSENDRANTLSPSRPCFSRGAPSPCYSRMTLLFLPLRALRIRREKTRIGTSGSSLLALPMLCGDSVSSDLWTGIWETLPWSDSLRDYLQWVTRQ